jgi:hypothetical protein
MILAKIDSDELEATLLCIVLESENVERMKKADPVTLESIRRGGILTPIKYPKNCSILIAIEEDYKELHQKLQGDRAELVKWLERGRVFIQGIDGKENTYRVPGPPKK